MAYYDLLIAHWPSVSGATTAIKLAALNAENVTGSIPATFPLTGDQIRGCLDFTEFNSLTAAKQDVILHLCSDVNLVGGSGSFVGKLFANYYSTMLAGPTIAALTALAQAVVQPWWKANGYPRAFDLGDISTAGLS